MKKKEKKGGKKTKFQKLDFENLFNQINQNSTTMWKHKFKGKVGSHLRGPLPPCEVIINERVRHDGKRVWQSPHNTRPEALKGPISMAATPNSASVNTSLSKLQSYHLDI